MSNSKTVKEEKKFVQLSPDTVSMLAESIGISGNNISTNVTRALAEDASYRCRELANVNIHFSTRFCNEKCCRFQGAEGVSKELPKAVKALLKRFQDAKGASMALKTLLRR
jgi:hypothetical protein